MLDLFFQVITTALLQAMLHSLWQGLVLWLLVATIKHTGKPSATTMYLLYTAGGLALASLFVIGFLAQVYWLMSAGPTSNYLQLAGIRHSDVWQIFDILAPYIAGLYGIAAIFRFWQLQYRLDQTYALRVQSLVKAPVEIRLFAQKMGSRMGITRPVKVFISQQIAVPLTIGVLKPIILLPLSLINNLSAAQVEAILVHEFVHIRRHDYLIMLALEVSDRLLLFNPWMRQLYKQACQHRETSCDEQVLQFKIAPRDYAEALLACGGHRSAAMAVAASGESTFELLQRIQKVMEQGQAPAPPPASKWLPAVIAVALLLALLPFGWKGPSANKPEPAAAASPAAIGSLSAKALWFWQNLPSGQASPQQAATGFSYQSLPIKGGILFLTAEAQIYPASKKPLVHAKQPLQWRRINPSAGSEAAAVDAEPQVVAMDTDETLEAAHSIRAMDDHAKITWREASLSDAAAIEQTIAANHWLETLNQAIDIMEQQAAAVAFRLHELSDKELATAQIILEKSLQTAEDAITKLMGLDQAASSERLAAQKAGFRQLLQKHLQHIKQMGDEARLRKAKPAADTTGASQQKHRSKRSVDL